MSQILLLTLFLAASLIPYAGHAQLEVAHNFNLELSEDSLTASRLSTSLNAFLQEAQHRAFTEATTDSLHVEAHSFFFHKLSGIGARGTLDFNPPSVVKSYSRDGKDYYLTVAFTGSKDGVPFVYQLAELKAVPYGERYRFYCRFAENTRHFHQTTVGNVRYYASNAVDTTSARRFADWRSQVMHQANIESDTLHYYKFASLDELLRAYGFLYSARQCNFLYYDLGFLDDGGRRYLTGTDNANYVVGYFGDMLYYHLPHPERLYRTFVEGASAFYGGYGLSNDSVEVLKQQFRAKLAAEPNVDFLAEFDKGRKSSVKRHFSHYVMSAFLCEAVLAEGEFADLLALAYSGKDGADFFPTLERVLGVTRGNFHDTIVRLISTS